VLRIHEWIVKREIFKIVELAPQKDATPIQETGQICHQVDDALVTAWES